MGMAVPLKIYKTGFPLNPYFSARSQKNVEVKLLGWDGSIFYQEKSGNTRVRRVIP